MIFGLALKLRTRNICMAAAVEFLHYYLNVHITDGTGRYIEDSVIKLFETGAST